MFFPVRTWMGALNPEEDGVSILDISVICCKDYSWNWCMSRLKYKSTEGVSKDLFQASILSSNRVLSVHPVILLLLW